MTNTSVYKELIRSAERRPEFGAVLDAVFKNRVVGRVLLISHSELFEELQIKDGKVLFRFRSRGLPYLSHRYNSLLSSWREHWGFLNEVLAEKQKAMTVSIQQLQESTGPGLRDRVTLAILATFQKNPALLELANRGEPVDIPQLRQVIGDYSGVDLSALESLLVDALPAFLQRPKHRRAINRLTVNLDSLFHVSDPDLGRRSIVWVTVARFVELLRVRQVSEKQWRRLVSALAEAGLLEASSTIYLWCRRCPEAGFTMPTTLTACALPPFCPSCGNEAHAIASLVPAGPLQDAVFAPDGLLGVAVAWHLRKRHFQFEAAKHTGTTEFDFLVKTRRGPILLECKMLHAVSHNLTRNLLSSYHQLREHMKELTKHGTRLLTAACVVNIPGRQLRSLLKNLSPEDAMDFSNIGGEMLSYEHFPKWLESQGVGTRAKN